MKPTVTIIILNWNGAQLLKEYLPFTISAIQNSEYPNRLIVADNASTDDSIQVLQQDFPEVEILQFQENLGFASGYNKAIDLIEEEFVLLLNSDAYLTENCLDKLMQAFENDISIAAAMPKIKSVREPNKFEYAGAAGGFIDVFGFPYCRGRVIDQLEEDTGQYDTTIPVLWASGAALLVRREVYLEAGGLDADFFAHMEEIDLCWRIWRRNYSVICVGDAEAYHYGGASLDSASPQKTYLNFRNNLCLIWKHWTSSQLIFKLLPRLILDGLIGILWIFQGKGKHTISIVKAHNHFFRSLKKWNIKRKELNQFSKKLPKGLISGSVLFMKK